MNHLINTQIQTAQQINELRNMILQIPGVNRAVNVVLSGLLINNTDQSIDSLLADEDEQ